MPASSLRMLYEQAIIFLFNYWSINKVSIKVFYQSISKRICSGGAAFVSVSLDREEDTVGFPVIAPFFPQVCGPLFTS